MLQKGELYDSLTFLIKTCESNHKSKPAAIIMGPDDYSNYTAELASRSLEGKPSPNASNWKIHGVSIMLSTNKGIDLAFPVAFHEMIASTQSEEKVEANAN